MVLLYGLVWICVFLFLLGCLAVSWAGALFFRGDRFGLGVSVALCFVSVIGLIRLVC